jgi:hypothetical protein
MKSYKQEEKMNCKRAGWGLNWGPTQKKVVTQLGYKKLIFLIFFLCDVASNFCFTQ